MSERKELTFQYEVAEGPDGLKRLLEEYFSKAQTDDSFAEVGHYVLYTLGDQRSLIRVDTSTVPFHFRYCDLLGRTATQSVKEVIARFLWEKCGEKERFMKKLREKHYD